MSFGWPAMLAALVVVPLLIGWYGWRQRQRSRAEAAFTSPRLAASPMPSRPRWRRHVPLLLLNVAVTALVLAAARPQHSVKVPVTGAGVMLVTDVSDSMASTDVRPSRLGAAKQASLRFLKGVPASVDVGQVEFARHPTLLQSPTTDRALTGQAVSGLAIGGGGTAIGDALNTALRALAALRQNGRKLPGAILLLSDGASNVGISPLIVAQQAKTVRVPVYTVAIGTARGTAPVISHGRRVIGNVPVSPQELGEIARLSGGAAFTATDAARARAVYAHLAVQIGRKRVSRDISAAFAGAGALFLLIGGGCSLFWFGRLA